MVILLKKRNDFIGRFPKNGLSPQQQARGAFATFFEIPILSQKIHPQRAVRKLNMIPLPRIGGLSH
jgi:hypothetical protein